MMRPPHLDIWPGLRGFRLVMTAGPSATAEILGTFRTWDEAVEAKRTAEAMSASAGRRAA